MNSEVIGEIGVHGGIHLKGNLRSNEIEDVAMRDKQQILRLGRGLFSSSSLRMTSARSQRL